MYVAKLARFNPWWTDRDAIGRDPKMVALGASALKTVPDPDMFEAGDYVYSLRGPRQVGKTTLVKLAIGRLLERVPPHNVMYYSFESERSPLDVENVLNEYFDKSGQSEKSRRYLFLDEISNVIDWQRAIKLFKDMNMLENCTVVTTGSHSVDLAKATELLGWRRGHPKRGMLDRVVMPMNFRRFVMATDRGLYEDAAGAVPPDPESRIGLLGSAARGEIGDPVKDLYVRQNELNRCLHRYLLAGGIPFIVDRLVKDGHVGDEHYGQYMDLVKGGFGRLGRNPALAGQIMGRIAECTGTAVSWSSIGDGTAVASHHTVGEYVKVLEGMFCASTVYRYNSSSDAPRYDAQKKLYYRDPFFFHMAGGMGSGSAYNASLECMDDPARLAALVEQVVCEHVVRLAYGTLGMRVAYGHDNAVFYWRSRNKREVDILVRDNGGLIPIEVKYQNQIRTGDTYGILDYKRATGAGGGILVSKNEMKAGRGICRLPASVFLFLA